MEQKKGKVKEWWDENCDAVVRLAVIFGGCAASYWAGRKITKLRVICELAWAFKQDPELEPRFWKAIEDSRKSLKS